MNCFSPANRRTLGRWLLVGASLSALSACVSLPSSGPTADDIVAEQKKVATGPAAFSILEIDSGVIDQLNAPSRGPILPALGDAGDVDLIGPGDVLQISIFEIGTTLFSPHSGGMASAGSDAPSSAGASLPPVVVSRDGTLVLPWLGTLQVAGKTPDALARIIQQGLKGKSQDPQVLVYVRENVTNTVIVDGDVKKPGRIPLTLIHERLSDAITLAGGPNDAPADSVVRLTRGDVSGTIALGDLQAGAAMDVPLKPQDRIEVILQPRTFAVFGATGKVSEIPFSFPRVSLSDAVARAGGPADQQADPTAIFVFRYDTIGPDGKPAPGAKPVAYRLDMSKPESYFLSQNFEMRNGDVIYIANARLIQTTKLLGILNQFFSPFYTAKVIAQ
jgi:polysaccharide export outer membrane protein